MNVPAALVALTDGNLAQDSREYGSRHSGASHQSLGHWTHRLSVPVTSCGWEHDDP